MALYLLFYYSFTYSFFQSFLTHFAIILCTFAAYFYFPQRWAFFFFFFSLILTLYSFYQGLSWWPFLGFFVSPSGSWRAFWFCVKVTLREVLLTWVLCESRVFSRLPPSWVSLTLKSEPSHLAQWNCREIGTVGQFYIAIKLPPLPLLEVAPFSTATATTESLLFVRFWLVSFLLGSWLLSGSFA